MNREIDELIGRGEDTERTVAALGQDPTPGDQRCSGDEPTKATVSMEVELERQRSGMVEVEMVMLTPEALLVSPAVRDEADGAEGAYGTFEIGLRNEDIDVARCSDRRPRRVEALSKQRALQGSSRDATLGERGVDRIEEPKVGRVIELSRQHPSRDVRLDVLLEFNSCLSQRFMDDTRDAVKLRTREHLAKPRGRRFSNDRKGAKEVREELVDDETSRGFTG